MNNKEEELLNEITKYVKKNHIMPTRRYLQRKLNYKSVNSITQYIKSLIKQNYLKYNDHNQLTINNYIYNNNLKTIKILNIKNKYISLVLEKRKKYCGIKINNNYFKKQRIFKNDLLIIEESKRLKQNDIGLFMINNKYRVMKYNYKDGFFILKDDEELILNKINIIGKVVMIERKI